MTICSLGVLLSVLNQLIVPCLVLPVTSWPAYRFLRRQVRWSVIATSLRISTVCCDPHSQRLHWLVNEAEVDVFLEFSYFFYDPTDVGSLISGSSASSKSSLYIWKFLVYILLKLNLKDFEPYLASMWNEHNCAVFKYSLALFFEIEMKTNLF